ncbi:hypothetical protein ACB092_03G117500 [Castanea dentata]
MALKLTLRSSDNEIFEIEERVGVQSLAIKNLVDDGCTKNIIPLPNLDGKTLAKDNKKEEKEKLKKYEAEFLDVDQDFLFHLIIAANFLNIKNLLDKSCEKVANMIKGKKKTNEICKAFSIKNDFTAEEEAEILRKNFWVFE